MKYESSKISNTTNNELQHSVERFGDPFAAETDWTPANAGGRSLRTHELCVIHENRLEFRTVPRLKFLYQAVSIGPLLFSLWAFAITYFSRGIFLSKVTVISFLVAVILLVKGGKDFYRFTTPIVFDKSKGFFWRSWKAADEVANMNMLKDAAKLEDIHALQLIREECSAPNKHFFDSYELNLVLEDGSRLNVVDHGDEAKLREDAHMLSKFLNKPVWDAI